MSTPTESPVQTDTSHSFLAGGGTLLRNAGALTLSRGVTLLSGLAVTAWLGRMLGPANYGIIGFATAVLSYFGLVVALGFETLGCLTSAPMGRIEVIA